VENLKKQGVIFVEKLDEIKDINRPVIFSAHGAPKSVHNFAKLNNIFFIDATCPLVSKVHKEAEQLYKNGFQILLIGHSNHPEVIGTMGQLPKNSVYLIETKKDAELYNNQSKNSGSQKRRYLLCNN
jgi:4-hydroxy-3-methylbut-2-enyl diphosphate reductase